VNNNNPSEWVGLHYGLTVVPDRAQERTAEPLVQSHLLTTSVRAHRLQVTYQGDPRCSSSLRWEQNGTRELHDVLERRKRAYEGEPAASLTYVGFGPQPHACGSERASGQGLGRVRDLRTELVLLRILLRILLTSLRLLRRSLRRRLCRLLLGSAPQRICLYPLGVCLLLC